MTTVERAVAYIRENLGEAPDIGPWPEDRSLPLYLRQTYQYRLGKIHGRGILLMIATTPEIPSPAVIAKQSKTVQDRAGLEPIVVLPTLSSYNRKRLVERRISFIVPGNQMYLAPLGIDFRERSRSSQSSVETVKPATQRAIVAILARELPEDEFCPSDLVEKLGYSPMTLTRVFRELDTLSFGDQTVSGRTRVLRLRRADRFELWNRVLPHLTTPIQRIQTVNSIDDSDVSLPLSGISALARHTSLSEPIKKTVAVDGDQWRYLRSGNLVQEVPSSEETATTVEVWKYSPPTQGDTVDPLSLYLSLRESPDERVQVALNHLLEKVPW